ncbi:MAG TPA: HEAT repeat domain-containing protein [Kofleriaceae bacterium]|nr:HEAT repeat domain-containing protein [Kofleriaceae bacterium]
MLRIAGPLLTLLACTGGPPTNGRTADKTPPPSISGSQSKTTLAQVQHAYPTESVDAAGIHVPGVELFALHIERDVPDDAENHPRIVAVVGGVGSPILEKQDVTLAVSKATNDPALLARVAMAVEQQGGEILIASKTREHERSKVGPPTIAGSTLTFWVWTSGVGRMLRLAKVDLATGAFTLTAPARSNIARVREAVEALAGTSLSMHAHAVETLSAACSTDPEARSALFEALSHHAREETRAASAHAAPACGAAAIDTLVRAMANDVSSKVRWTAAKALGDIGDPKAKPALEAAATSSDANVRSVAARALDKLK